MIIILNSFAFYPVSTPVGAEEWGNPISTENPHASSWPASEQYTWLHDGAVIGVVHLRTPHTFSSMVSRYLDPCARRHARDARRRGCANPLRS